VYEPFIQARKRSAFPAQMFYFFLKFLVYLCLSVHFVKALLRFLHLRLPLRLHLFRSFKFLGQNIIKEQSCIGTKHSAGCQTYVSDGMGSARKELVDVSW